MHGKKETKAARSWGGVLFKSTRKMLFQAPTGKKILHWGFLWLGWACLANKMPHAATVAAGWGSGSVEGT
jgi:hypothetical protein